MRHSSGVCLSPCLIRVLLPNCPDRAASTRHARHYEFPTGFNMLFGGERFHVGEQFFTHPPHMIVRDVGLTPNMDALISLNLKAIQP